MTSLLDPLEQLFGHGADELFSKRQFVVQNGPKARLPEWMRQGPLENIESLCRQHKGAYQIAQGGTGSVANAEPESFIGSGGQTPVSGSRPHALLRLGLTVYFSDMEKSVPGAGEFKRALESALGLPPCVGVSAFVNAPGSGLPFHHDSFDQLLIQLQGEKTFTRALREPLPHPRISASPSGPTPQYFESIYSQGFVEDDAEIAAEGLETHVLEPGSCFFMPAGTWHRTERQEQSCLSLVVAVRAPSMLDLILNALPYFAGQESSFRRPAHGMIGCDLDVGETKNQRKLHQEQVATALRQLCDQLGRLDAAALERCWWAARQKDGDAKSYPSQQAYERYIRLPGSKVRFEAAPSDQLRLVVRCAHSIDDGVLEFHELARPVIDAVLQTKAAFDKGELAARFDDFEEQEVFDLLERLAQVGLLRPLPAPLFG
jgi:quercetin dioxygenase-like cupin family protein